jgi:hypothetical protein
MSILGRTFVGQSETGAVSHASLRFRMICIAHK